MELLNEFLHIYFWVFLVVAILILIINYKKPLNYTERGINVPNIIGWVIWIMSWSR